MCYGKYRYLIFGMTLLFLMNGCNSKIRTKGVIKFTDGELITSGYILFSNGQQEGRGEINQDGTFSMGMLKPGEGLPPGKYKIYFAGGPLDMSKDVNGIFIIHPKYYSYDTTPLSADINRESIEPFDIVLERNPKTIH